MAWCLSLVGFSATTPISPSLLSACAAARQATNPGPGTRPFQHVYLASEQTHLDYQTIQTKCLVEKRALSCISVACAANQTRTQAKIYSPVLEHQNIFEQACVISSGSSRANGVASPRCCTTWNQSLKIK